MNDWIDVKERKPTAFDLVIVQDAKGFTQKGWWTGGGWDFGVKRISGEVVKWKKTFEKIIKETGRNQYMLD